MHWADGSEAYVTPVGDELVGIAMLTERQAPFDELLAEHVLLKERLERRPFSRTRGAGPAAPALDRTHRWAGCCSSVTPPATSTR